MSLDPAQPQADASPEVGGGALRDAVVEMTQAQGAGLTTRVEGSTAIVTRRTDFLSVTPTPDGGLDLVLQFPAGAPDDPRLEPADGAHRVHVAASDVDADLLALEPLLEAAYAQNG